MSGSTEAGTIDTLRRAYCPLSLCERRTKIVGMSASVRMRTSLWKPTARIPALIDRVEREDDSPRGQAPTFPALFEPNHTWNARITLLHLNDRSAGRSFDKIL